jgi:hypothetical protein
MTGPIATSREYDIREALHLRLADLRTPTSSERLPEPSLKGQYTRVDNALARINEITTPQGQRTLYGAERWARDFQFLSELHSPYPNSDDHKIRDEVWRALPASKFKFFQELFVHPLDRIVPKVSPFGTTDQLFSRDHVRSLSVLGCIVHPDMLPDDMLHRLGIVNFVSESGKLFRPVERLERKAQLSVVSQLKLLWDASQPLSRGQYRVLVLREPTPTLCGRYELSVDPARKDVYGQVLLSHFDADTGSRVVQLFTEVRSLMRRFEHARKEYNAETEALAAARSSSAEARTVLRQGSEYDRRATELLQSAGDSLGSPRDPVKVDAQNRLARAAPLRDSDGRRNILIAASRASAAESRLGKRAEAAANMLGYLEKDRLLVKGQVELEASHLKSFFSAVTNAARSFRVSPDLGKDTLFTDEKKDAARGFVQRLGLQRENFEKQFLLLPYRRFAEQSVLAVLALESALQLQSRGGAAQSITDLLVIKMRFDTYQSISDMKAALVHPERTSFRRLFDASAKLAQDHQMAVGLMAAGLMDGETEERHNSELLIRLVSRMKSRLATYKQQSLSEEDRLRVYDNLKKYCSLIITHSTR